MKQSLRSSRNICIGDQTESEYDAYERYRAEKRERIHVNWRKKRRAKRWWRRRRAKQRGIPTWLERDEQQLEDQEFAQIYEELMSTNDHAPCTTLEDESTYKYLESYYYK